jgi:iron complex outermembrane receptor protein
MIAGGCAAMGSVPVLAQSPSLEEVLVTAQRRETRLQETPIAVTAIGAAELEARAVSDVTDIGQLAPNLYLRGGANSAGTANNAQIYMRGIGQTDFLPTSDPGVGLYLDDVYLGRSVGGVLRLPDMERVEVLRGPQGTLFGRNTIGGAINLITRKPVLGELDATVGVTAGNDDWQQTDGAVNVPFGERAAGRFSWNYITRDGYGESTVVDTEFGNDENVALRGQIKWGVNDSVDVLFAADWYDQNQSSTPSVVYGTDLAAANVITFYNAFAPLLGVAPFTEADLGSLADPFDTSSKLSPSTDSNETWGTSLVLNWRPQEWLNVKSITAYREIDAHYADDADVSVHYIVTTDEHFEQDQFSQELQLYGNTSRFDWLLGGYYFRERAISENVVPIIPGLVSALEALPGAFIPVAPGVPCPPVCAGGAGNPLNLLFDFGQVPHNDITVHSYAVFGQVTYHATDRLSGTFGGRYSYEKKDFYTFNLKPEATAVAGVAIFAVPPTDKDASFNDFSPKVGVEFKVLPDLLAYFSYSQGFRSGTFNGRSGAQRAVQSVDPEDLETFEVGFKSEWFDQRLRLNGAGYYSIYENIQFISVEADPVAGFIVFLRNAEESKIHGFELEALASVTEQFSVYANAGLTDTEVTEIDPAIALTTGVSEGNKLRKAPEWTYALGGRYAQPTAIGNFVGNIDWSWQSKVYHEASNRPQETEDSYGLLNLRLAWQSLDGHYEIAGFARNLTDETYFNSLFFQGGAQDVAYPARDREYGVSLRWNY